MEEAIKYESEGMTVEELANFLGRGEKAIRRRAKKLNINIEQGKAKIFNKSEIEKIAYDIYNGIPEAIRDSIDYKFNPLQHRMSVRSEHRTSVRSEPLPNEQGQLSSNDRSGYDPEIKEMLKALTQVVSILATEVKTIKSTQLALPAPTVPPKDPNAVVRSRIKERMNNLIKSAYYTYDRQKAYNDLYNRYNKDFPKTNIMNYKNLYKPGYPASSIIDSIDNARVLEDLLTYADIMVSEETERQESIKASARSKDIWGDNTPAKKRIKLPLDKDTDYSI